MSPTYRCIHVEIFEKYAVLSLNRVEKKNALHHDMLTECLSALHFLETKEDIRVLLLRSNGSDFCAGADIHWMQSSALSDFETNVNEAELLAELLYLIYTYTKPVIALAQGNAMGGAIGLLAASDIVLAERNALFALPEVKIGLIPAIVSPYLIQTIGARAARYYCLTGQSFSAEKALELQLIHRITESDELHREGLNMVNTLLNNAPNASSAIKTLIRKMNHEPITVSLVHDNAVLLARTRASHEAQKGIRSFLEKTKLNWSA